MKETKMYTLKEAANRLMVSGATLHRWIHKRKIGAIRIGYRWYFTDAHINAMQKEYEAEENYNEV